ncbi:MAG: MFS transporter [Oligoflexia bacterium]|nr:MFS transporter [Oligoflexia bacterium]
MEADRGRSAVLRAYYGFQIFFSLLIWVPVFYEYQKRIGLSDREIFGIQSIYYLVFCLLEIPTGYFADRWGYVRSLRAGALVLVLSNLLPPLVPTYGGMLAHFLLIALSRSLISGASSAYLYEYLAGEGKGYRRAEGGARAMGLGAKVILWAGVGALMEWHLSLPYWLTVVTSVISVGFVWRLPPLTIPARAGERPGLGAWVDVLRKTPLLILVMLQGLSVFVLARILQVNLFQPLLGAKGFTVASYGAVMAMMTLMEAGGSLLAGAGAPALFSRTSAFGWVSVLTLGVAGSVAIAALGPAGSPLLVGAGLGLFSFLVGLAYPIQRQLMNNTIPDLRYRATLLSFESIIDRAACAWVAASLGGYVAAGRVSEFLVAAAAASAVLIGALFLAIRSLKVSGN